MKTFTPEDYKRHFNMPLTETIISVNPVKDGVCTCVHFGDLTIWQGDPFPKNLSAYSECTRCLGYGTLPIPLEEVRNEV